MSRRTVVIGHGNPNKESWVKRAFNHTGMATGGVYTDDCLIPDQAHTLIIMNKCMYLGKSEQRLNSIRGLMKQKVLPET